VSITKTTTTTTTNNKIMPTLKNIDDDEWSTQPHTATKNPKIHKDVEEEDSLLDYEKNMKLAIIDSLSEHNRTCRQKQSKIEIDVDNGGKVKYRIPTGMTQEPSRENRQPVEISRVAKKRKTEDEDQKMAASMHSFLKKPPHSSNVDTEECFLVNTQNTVTPIRACMPTSTVESYHSNEDENAIRNETTDAEQTSNMGSEGSNEQSGNTFYRFEGLLKVCVIRNTPAGSEFWLNPEAISEFITHFEKK
jgi:hypothetical protein